MYGGVVQQQPGINLGGFQPMAFPGQLTNVPAGLEYLAVVDQLIIKQEVSVFEILAGFEAKNKYRVLNSMNQQAYWAFEESDFCHRICCGPERGFTIHITDNSQQEVMSVVRDFRYCACCTLCADGCCMYPIVIKDKFGQKLGMTRAMNFCCTPRLGIFDNDDQLLYEITGPCCPCQGPCCTGDVNYPITSAKDGQQVGNISKIWGGVMREAFTDSETFGVQFPMDLDVKHKALMIGAVFLVDFIIFERMKNNNHG
ncbi:hypothetical protein RRG08_024758 [Elysia crispata]|uniref:Phospholipid scramblase n=1 Tax=Elysia crispata TaxID=231223 RepID=A0AAE1CT35_9GAST|nr:hypothetical protein RRG08_024758 [Elysia crispata]